MPSKTYHPLYLRGIDQFNRRNFFQSHELWEELWMEETGHSRLFYKGLIQAAVALHHLAHGNRSGARKLLFGAGQYLGPYQPKYLGLDVEDFVSRLTTFIEQTLSGVDWPGRGRIKVDEAPLIDLDPPALISNPVRYS